ncbi:MAG: hypothetical protein RLZZ142_1149 [Verrucomicrobiota bacterium]
MKNTLPLFVPLARSGKTMSCMGSSPLRLDDLVLEALPRPSR